MIEKNRSGFISATTEALRLLPEEAKRPWCTWYTNRTGRSANLLYQTADRWALPPDNAYLRNQRSRDSTRPSDFSKDTAWPQKDQRHWGLLDTISLLYLPGHPFFRDHHHMNRERYVPVAVFDRVGAFARPFPPKGIHFIPRIRLGVADTPPRPQGEP